MGHCRQLTLGLRDVDRLPLRFGGVDSLQRQGIGQIDFLLLGPTEARKAGHAVPLSGVRRRTLLSRLLLANGRPVPTDTIFEDVWDGRPPAAAAATLQSHISQLRKVLGDRLQRSTNGYALLLDSATVDATTFEAEVATGTRLLAAGDVWDASERLRTALLMWRGHALEDVADRHWALPVAQRLEELRRATVDSLLEAELALGHQEQVVVDAELAVREEPLREQRWGVLMIALYRCGRQAEALRAYRRLADQLLEELGIDPSPALAELERAVLEQNPALDALFLGPKVRTNRVEQTFPQHVLASI